MKMTEPGQIKYDSTTININFTDGYYNYTGDHPFHADKTVMYGCRSAFPYSRLHDLAVKHIIANS